MTDTTLTRALDLTRAVTDILNKSGAISGLVGQVVKWLTREGIPEGEFAYCLEKSKALIYPNDNGLQIRSRLKENDAKLKAKPYVAGLKLVSALTIGKWMTYDPDYCYLVTTVAALFAHHDMSYASEAVCDMLLDKGNHKEGTSQVYRYEKSRLLPVVKKIVESITLNVINGSGNSDNLPEEIRRMCSHYVDPHTFAAVAMAIYQSSGDVIIHCNRPLADLYLWLLTHIEGDICISVAGSIVHSATFGRPLRRVTMFAESVCSNDHDEIASTLVLSVNVGGTFSTLLQHTAGKAHLCEHSTNIRQPLYDIEFHGRTERRGTVLTTRELRDVHIAGQRIVRWLMARPAIVNDSNSQIQYSTRLDDDRSEPSGLTVEALLSRWPAICNRNFGPETSGCDFEAPNPPVDSNTYASISYILNWFPHVRKTLSHVRSRCRCMPCRFRCMPFTNGRTMRDAGPGIASKPGCLVRLAVNDLVLIIAHAIADGFGIPDASNLSDPSIVRTGLQELMTELIVHKRIAWKTWFSLAACTYLGCPWPVERQQHLARKRFAELVAIQHGSAVVVALWVDIRSALAPQNSFGCFVAAGQLSGMSTDFGVLYTEDTSPPAVTQSGWRLPDYSTTTADISRVFLNFKINGGSGLPFRLMIMARAGNYVRIINPATVVMALSRSAYPCCNHEQRGGIISPPQASSYQTWSAEHALGLWGEINVSDQVSELQSPQPYPTYCTASMDDVTNINILLALSPSGCVVKQNDCCLACAMARLGGGVGDSRGRRIICVSNVRGGGRNT